MEDIVFEELADYDFGELADYDFGELADMCHVYGEVHYNSLAAEKLYRERFPKRRHPSAQGFAFVNQQLRETGSLRPRREGCGIGRSTGTTNFEKKNTKDTIPEIDMNPVSVQESKEADDLFSWVNFRDHQKGTEAAAVIEEKLNIELLNILDGKLPPRQYPLLPYEVEYQKEELQRKDLEKQLYEEKVRAAKARADLAELKLQEFRKKI